MYKSPILLAVCDSCHLHHSFLLYQVPSFSEWKNLKSSSRKVVFWTLYSYLTYHLCLIKKDAIKIHQSNVSTRHHRLWLWEQSLQRMPHHAHWLACLSHSDHFQPICSSWALQSPATAESSSKIQQALPHRKKGLVVMEFGDDRGSLLQQRPQH